MAIAALVIGIISLILGFIPLCNIIMVVPAIVGLILGIVALVKSKKPEGEEKSKKGMSLAGVIINAIALIVIIVWNVIVIGFAASNGGNALNALNDTLSNYNYTDYNSDYNYND